MNETALPPKVEYAGTVKFSGPDGGPVQVGSTWADWQQRAMHEYRLSRLVVPFLNMDDEELAKVVADDPESFMDLYESCAGQAETYKCGVEVMNAMSARIMICLARFQSFWPSLLI